jgi:hypothetical protein
MKSELSGALERMEVISWLDSQADWDVFFTGTTRYIATCRSLRKSFEGFMRSNYKAVSYVYTLEPHVDTGFHVHAMFDEPYLLSWNSFWERWYERYGRARTDPIRHKANVALYVTKYLTKEWDKNKEELVGDPKVNTDGRKEIWWNVKITERQFKRSQNYSLSKTIRSGGRLEPLGIGGG